MAREEWRADTYYEREPFRRGRAAQERASKNYQDLPSAPLVRQHRQPSPLARILDDSCATVSP